MTKQHGLTVATQISRRGLLCSAAAVIAIGSWHGKAEATASSSAAAEWGEGSRRFDEFQLFHRPLPEGAL